MAKKTEIVHKTYSDDGLQSVNFEVDGAIVKGAGAVLPGKYSDKANKKETIYMTNGSLIINGKMYTTNINHSTNRPEPCIINTGEDVVIEATEEAMYICFYG